MNRPLACLLTAEALSMLGSRIAFVAIPWLVLTTTDSPILAGVAGFAEMLPYVLAGLLGGPLIDRIGPRPVAVAADLTSVPVVCAVPLLWHSGARSFGLLVVLVAVAGALRGFGDAGKRTLFPRVLAASGMSTERGTALYDGIGRAATLAGLPLAGLLVATVGAADVLLFDAATFGASALLVAFLVPGTPPGPADQRYLAALAEGFRYLRGDRLSLGIVTMLFATNLFDQAYSTVFVPLWIRDVLHSPAALGMTGAAFGAGAVAGNLAYTVLAPRLPRHRTFALCFLLGGSAQLFALALTDRLWILLLTAAGAGALLSTVNPILMAVAYERIPPDLQGRVLGAALAAAWAGIPLGGLIAGWAAQGLGLRAGALVAAAGYLAVTAAPFLFARWRELDARPVSVAR
ncbi:MFS transporter [Actinoplanes sp. NPDC049548]|uniref:MFS transporter n=1 Tax=Actinoplanes sp. NPDC049548 TaxID=3155152 RepID=UPI0034141420